MKKLTCEQADAAKSLAVSYEAYMWACAQLMAAKRGTGSMSVEEAAKSVQMWGGCLRSDQLKTGISLVLDVRASVAYLTGVDIGEAA